MVEEEKPRNLRSELLDLSLFAGKIVYTLERLKELNDEGKRILCHARTLVGETRVGNRERIGLGQLALIAYKESLPSRRERKEFKGEKSELLIGLKKIENTIEKIEKGEQIPKREATQTRKFFNSLQENFIIKAKVLDSEDVAEVKKKRGWRRRF